MTDQIEETLAEVNDLARALMAEWERVEGEPVGVSYVATFADLARVALRHREQATALRATERVAPGVEAVARAKFDVDSRHHFHGTACTCGFDSRGRARSMTEHITAMIAARIGGGA